MARYLFINTSANRAGNTAQAGESFIEGLDAETIHLVDHTIGFFGQKIAGDTFDEVFEATLAADTIILGSPIYTDTMSSAARTFLERLETHPRAKELSGRGLLFFIQGFNAGQLLVDSTTATVKNAIEPQGMRFIGTATNLVELAEIRDAME